MCGFSAISWDDVGMRTHTHRRTHLHTHVHTRRVAASSAVASVEHFLVHLQAANPVLQMLELDRA